MFRLLLLTTLLISSFTFAQDFTLTPSKPSSGTSPGTKSDPGAMSPEEFRKHIESAKPTPPPAYIPPPLPQTQKQVGGALNNADGSSSNPLAETMPTTPAPAQQQPTDSAKSSVAKPPKEYNPFDQDVNKNAETNSSKSANDSTAPSTDGDWNIKY